MTTIAVGEVRRWVRRRQAAHRERGETLGNFYFALLFVAIVGGMVHRQIAAVLWPGHPNASPLAGVSLAVALIGTLYLLLRRLGPLALSRPASSWLLTAPVSRRALLLPSLGTAVVLAAVVGALGSLGIMGHVLVHPVATLPLLGALAAVGVLLIALAAQADQWWTDLSDNAAYLLLAAGLAGLVVDSAVDATFSFAGRPFVVPAMGALTAIVVAGLAFSVRSLARTPNDRILEATTTAGTLADSVYGVEPSFVTEMVERRYWARRVLRSRRLWRRVPVLTAQDLLLLRRRPRRLLWLAGGVALPALFSSAPAWVLAVAVLIGGLIAGGTTTANVRTDTGNPWMLRMLGISSRDAILQRLSIPITLAALWSAATLTLLQILGDLPAGPWWLLGLVLGPVGGVAAVRKARTGFVNNTLMPVDTPMGSIATGPLLAAFAGVDVLLLGVPSVVLIGQGGALSWTDVLLQAAISALGVRAYLAGTTAKDRVELNSY